MHHKPITIFILLLGTAGSLVAQSSTDSLRVAAVYADQQGTPLQGVEITASINGASVHVRDTTGADGRFALTIPLLTTGIGGQQQAVFFIDNTTGPTPTRS